MKAPRSRLAFLCCLLLIASLILCPSAIDAKKVKKKKAAQAQAPMFQLDEEKQRQIQEEIERMKDKLGRERFADEKAAKAAGGLHIPGIEGYDTEGMQQVDTRAPGAAKFPMAIHDAIIDGDPLLVQVAVSEGGKDINEIGPGGQTPIVHAILLGHDDVVEWLLFAGANLTIKEDQGFSPMHAAAHAGRERSVRMLAAFGMDPSERHRDGWTPIHYASWADGNHQKHTDTVRVLLEMGVPHDELTPHGHLPIQLAMEKKNLATVDLLSEWRDKPPVDQAKILGALREQASSALAAKALSEQRSREIREKKAEEEGAKKQEL